MSTGRLSKADFTEIGHVLAVIATCVMFGRWQQSIALGCWLFLMWVSICSTIGSARETELTEFVVCTRCGFKAPLHTTDGSKYLQDHYAVCPARVQE